jgi:uncharacterized metal-binding protein YceD (DUF177 family)
MALLINLRHLEKDNLELKGELPVSELDLEGVDELIKLEKPLKYDLEAQQLEKSVLVQGNLELTLQCECARCLKPFNYKLKLEDWACLLALEGEEQVSVTNDCIDLTPAIREDILLGFPQHPLCKADCGGLPKKVTGKKKTEKKTGGAGQTEESSSAWSELNKLKF